MILNNSNVVLIYVKIKHIKIQYMTNIVSQHNIIYYKSTKVLVI